MSRSRWILLAIVLLACATVTLLTQCSNPSGEPDGGGDAASDVVPSTDAPTGSDASDASIGDGGGIDWDAAAPPCTGVPIPPGTDTIQGPVADAGPGTTFCLSAGIYRVTSAAKLKQNQSVYGAGATKTFVYGSIVVTQWADAGTGWVADLTEPDGGSALDGNAIDLNADFPPPEPPFYWGANSYNTWFDHARGDTFYTGQRLTRVGEVWKGATSPSDAGAPTSLGPGELYVDYDSHLVYVGSDPGSATVEVALTPTAFVAENATSTGVTIAYLAVQRFGNTIPFEDPIEPGTGWSVHHIDGSYNHGSAIHLTNGINLSHSRFFENGCIGAGGGMTGGLIDSCDVEENNKEIRVQGGTGNGGIKVGATTDSVIRNCIASNNYGPGIWFDVGSRFVLVENNTVQNNVSEGIRHEIGFECVVRNNLVSGNFGVPGDRGDIVMAASGAADLTLFPLDPFWLDAGFGNSIEIYDNTIAVGDAGEPAVDVGQGPRYQATMFLVDGGLHLTRNVHVHDNAVALSGPSGRVGVTDSMPADASVDPWDAGNAFTRNAYTTGGQCAQTYWTWSGANLSFTQWQSAGQDPSPMGTCK